MYRRSGAFGLRRSHRCLTSFWWTVVVFRRYRPPSSVKKAGSSSRELGSPPEFVVPASAPEQPGAPSMGSPTSSRHQPCESTSSGHPRPAYVPSSAFHALSTACSSHCLADLFHPAATSRFPAPGGSSPDLTATTSSVALAFAPLAPSSCRRLPVDSRVRRVDLKAFSRPGSAASNGGVSPADCPCPLVRFCSFGLASPVSETQLPSPPLTVLAARCSQCPGQRTLSVYRLATSMLYP